MTHLAVDSERAPPNEPRGGRNLTKWSLKGWPDEEGNPVDIVPC